MGRRDAAGPGVDRARAGRRVYGAQSYRPFGTAAQATVVPQALAVDLPDAVSDQRGRASASRAALSSRSRVRVAVGAQVST